MHSAFVLLERKNPKLPGCCFGFCYQGANCEEKFSPQRFPDVPEFTWHVSHSEFAISVLAVCLFPNKLVFFFF